MRASLTPRLALCAVAGVALLLPACNDGHLNLFGYTTEPPYDRSICTVYVPIPQNVTFRRGLEFDLKRALDREIESKTPYKVASSPEGADTELICKIVSRTKNVVVVNQNNEIRDAETTLGVEVSWRDLRIQPIYDALAKQPATAAPAMPSVDPLAPRPPAPPAPPAPLPILVTAPSNFVPELGGSLTTAEKQMVDRLAVQIVSMMEKGW